MVQCKNKGCPAAGVAASRIAGGVTFHSGVVAAPINFVVEHGRYAGAKHPSAKQVDEAEPLRLKVAELEGKLQHAQKCLVGVVPGAFVKILATICLLVGVGFGLLLP